MNSTRTGLRRLLQRARWLRASLRARRWPATSPAGTRSPGAASTERPPARLPGGDLVYVCNVCGARCASRLDDLQRETPSCLRCRSTVRMRAIVHLLSRELFGRSLSLPEFPVDKQLTGVGLSDWEVYADQLAAKLDYRNTYLDRDPKLDITRIDPSLERSLDFLISTDVFEHVQPPVSVAFENAYRLLKPGGCLILTVPYTNEPGTRTVEHFPDLYDFELQTAPGQPARLRNRTRDGQEQVFDDLVFHGGGGLTLEMRVFTEESLLEELARAGFEDVRICREPDLEHGVYWACDWSLPLVARSRRSAGPG